MTQHVHWLVLNDGVAERVIGADIDPAEEARVIDAVLIPLTESRPGTVGGRDSAYIVTGEVGGKYAALRMYDEGVPIADIAICLHSRAAAGLWERLLLQGESDDLTAGPQDRPPQAPWCAVLCYAPEAALPPWLDAWTKTVAMALVRREGW